jgi:hypothetical protein
VAENKWFFHHERSDAAFLVVVDVRTADAYGPDLDENLVRSRFWYGNVFEPHVVRAVHDRRFVLHGVPF